MFELTAFVSEKNGRARVLRLAIGKTPFLLVGFMILAIAGVPFPQLLDTLVRLGLGKY